MFENHTKDFREFRGFREFEEFRQLSALNILRFDFVALGAFYRAILDSILLSLVYSILKMIRSTSDKNSDSP